MRRLRIGIIGAGALTEWALLPALSGPDALTPPDSGAWWGRRPGAHAEIHYQPPALPVVAALSDADIVRARRVGDAWRIRAVYSDWRQMLREIPLDAVLCTAGPDVAAEVILAMRGSLGPRRLWVDGPPAPTAEAADDLHKMLEPSPAEFHLWCARPVRHAAAHRAARRLLERGGIGPVAGLSLRWGAALYQSRVAARGGNNGAARALSRDETVTLSSSYAAADLLMAFAAPVKDPARDEAHFWHTSAAPVAMLASQKAGVATWWLHFADGTSAVALFAPAENWSSPLPRLEICGTEGRSIVCEGGRRLWVHEPHEAARLLEPPGLAAQISAANLSGVSEDVKAFLAACAAGRLVATSERRPALETAIRALRVVEAANESLRSGRVVEIEPSGRLPFAEEEAARLTSPLAAEAPGTLPLNFET